MTISISRQIGPLLYDGPKTFHQLTAHVAGRRPESIYSSLSSMKASGWVESIGKWSKNATFRLTPYGMEVFEPTPTADTEASREIASLIEMRDLANEMLTKAERQLDAALERLALAWASTDEVWSNYEPCPGELGVHVFHCDETADEVCLFCDFRLWEDK